MPTWLDAALDYVPRWLEHQMAVAEQPGCVVAIARHGHVIFERAWGVANLDTAEPLTPRHRFRIASHSKTFTAAAVLILRERGKLGLDDAAGRYVAGLHPDVARATIGQLLSHSAGLTRDGPDAGQFMDARPYLSVAELKADLSKPQPLPPAETFKYSNHGMALLGLIVEAVTGEPYDRWVAREVIAAVGLNETVVDMPLLPTPRPPFAHGHSTKLPYGRRFVVPGDGAANAVAAAGGFVSTARDLVRFYAQLDPAAPQSILSATSRREQTRRHWRDRHASIERHYGYGTMVSAPGPFAAFGHGGSWQGTLSRTLHVPEHGLTVSVLTNAVDGPAQPWCEGILHICRTMLERAAAPDATTSAWTGRYWSLWLPVDLVPIGAGRVLVATPGTPTPFAEATVLAIEGISGRVTEAQAYGDLGEPVHLADGAFHLGGKRLLPEAAFKAEMAKRYGAARTA
jgi:CubicO group peptidase (beta-lactamase class C family)